MFTTAVATLWLIAGLHGSDIVGHKVFYNPEACQEFRDLVTQVYPELTVTECIAVPLMGTGESPVSNEAP